MNKIKFTTQLFVSALLMCFAMTLQAQTAPNKLDLFFGERSQTKFDFANAPAVNVANVEDLYAAVNNPPNAGNQIVLAAGVYQLSATDSGGAARPNGGRLELQENMALRGVAGNRGAVIIDASNLPAGSYNGEVPNTGAIRLGKGNNAVEWLTVRNAVSGGAGIIVHLSAPGTAFVRIAHCVSTGNQRGIDIRNLAAGISSFVIEAEIVDNDLHNNLISTAQGLRIINTQGVSGSIINAYLSGNQMFENQQGLLVENIGSTNGGIISIYSSGDRFFENGGGATIGAGLGPSDNNTVNFTAVGSTFENNNAFTGFYRGGLNVAGSVSFQVPNGGSNNTANVTLRNCRFANNQVADLAAYGASSLPVEIGLSGTNNRANVKIFGTVIPNLRTAESDPAQAAGINFVNVIRPMPFDFDGDTRADLSVFRPSDQTWYLNRSSQGFSATQFGLATDKPVSGDFDGDGKTDIAAFRDGNWYWLASSNNQFNAVQFGLAGDIPQVADFDGDGRSEPAIYRNGVWWWLNRATNQFHASQFGLAADKPIAADYNGDGKTDQAVFRNGEWHLNLTNQGYTVVGFGLATDKPIPADYDGDGKTDVAVYRNGTWYVLQSANGFTQFQFGISTDIPAPADYDGDGKTDAAVYRNGTWYLRQSTNGISVQQFGLANDKPIPSAYLP